ncbi:LytR family transcriptional regulator, partial [Bacillus thuringiensis]|nr:LytR family transcriptional regulator [Bacillus thuringiensis]
MGNHSSLREEKNKQKYKKKTIISLLLAVLLFGGIGYGAYVYMKTSSLVQKSNLNL